MLTLENWFRISYAMISASMVSQGKKKHSVNPNFFGPDIFGWGEGLPCEGVLAKKFGMSFETQGNLTFRREQIPGFLPGDAGKKPEKLEKKRFVFNF